MKANSAFLAGALKAHSPRFKVVYAKVMHGVTIRLVLKEPQAIFGDLLKTK